MNSLAKRLPELLKEWDYEKNIVSHNEISYKSNKKSWWHCKKGHEWCAMIGSRTRRSAAFWCLLNTNSYDEAIIKAINLGRDTDTVGACTGGLDGIYYGLESINEDWKKTLIKYDYIAEMCEKFDEVLGE